MSKTVHISSKEQFAELLRTSRIVVADCEFGSTPPPSLEQPESLPMAQTIALRASLAQIRVGERP